MNHLNRRKADDSMNDDLELQVVIQRLSDQVGRILSDAESEKESRRRTNKDLLDQMEKIRLEMKSDIREIRDILDRKFVSKDQFEPVKKFTYGFMGVALTALLVAVLSFVLRQQPEPPSYPRDGGQEQMKPDLPQ